MEKFDEYLQEQKLKSPLKFVVHFSSEFDVDGQNAGSRVISWVDKNFHTLEEKRTEYGGFTVVSLIITKLSIL